jgi:hypothetical protein
MEGVSCVLAGGECSALADGECSALADGALDGSGFPVVSAAGEQAENREQAIISTIIAIILWFILISLSYISGVIMY